MYEQALRQWFFNIKNLSTLSFLLKIETGYKIHKSPPAVRHPVAAFHPIRPPDPFVRETVRLAGWWGECSLISVIMWGQSGEECTYQCFHCISPVHNFHSAILCSGSISTISIIMDLVYIYAMPVNYEGLRLTPRSKKSQKCWQHCKTGDHMPKLRGQENIYSTTLSRMISHIIVKY